MDADSPFEELVSGLDYPMYVVTTAVGSERAGCLVGFTTQTSIQPTRFLVCLSKENETTRVAVRAAWLAVHLLREGDEDVARRFGEQTAADGVDKFAACAWAAGPGGVPVLAGLDCFIGRVTLRMPSFGDHIGHLLVVDDRYVLVDDARARRRPLGFQGVRDLDPGHPVSA